jgi:hypothetical protein
MNNMSETNKMLNDIRAYIRLSAAATAKASAFSIIDSYEKGLIYEKLDGHTTQVKLEQTTKIPQSTINRWLELFLQGRIITPPDEYYPSYRALFTLQELGIALDALKKREKKNAITDSKTKQFATKTKPEETKDNTTKMEQKT